MHINLLDKSLIGYFSIIKDLRDNRGKLHELVDIFVIAICAAICGCDDWVDIADFGKAKKNKEIFYDYYCLYLWVHFSVLEALRTQQSKCKAFMKEMCERIEVVNTKWGKDA